MTIEEFARAAVLAALVTGMGGVAVATFHAGAKAIHTARVLSAEDQSPKRPNCAFLGENGQMPPACMRDSHGQGRRVGRPMV